MKDGPVSDCYIVTHKNGAIVKKDKRYFVLAPDSDPFAAEALRVYARLIEVAYPELSQSIIERYGLDTVRRV